MGGFHGVGDDALQRVVGLDYVHLAARNHGVAHFQIGKIKHVFQPLQGVGIEYFALVRLAQGLQYFGRGFGGITGDAAHQSFKKTGGFRRAVVHQDGSSR